MPLVAESVKPRILVIRGHNVMLDADLARKIEALERKYDAQFKEVFEAIRQLVARRRLTRRHLP